MEGLVVFVMWFFNEKFFFNGLDLEWIMGMDENYFGGDCVIFGVEFMMLVGWLIIFFILMVCVINGYGFGVGLMIFLCYDVWIMCCDRGFLCVNEVEIGFVILELELVFFKYKMFVLVFFEII